MAGEPALPTGTDTVGRGGKTMAGVPPIGVEQGVLSFEDSEPVLMLVLLRIEALLECAVVEIVGEVE